MKHNATPDSSFWINAHRSGLLPYVLERFQLHYALAVGAELRLEFTSGREFWRLVDLGVLMEAATELSEVTEFGPGERAAINLTLGHPDWVILMDDRRPFLEAERRGLKALCAPALLVQLFVEGRIDARLALEMMARLAAMQTISPDLIAAALAHLGRVLGEKEER